MNRRDDAEFRNLLLILGIGVACFVLALLESCASLPEPLHNQDPFVKQILMPRKGYENNLTNRTCRTQDDKGTCIDWSVVGYDLHDEPTRAKLITNSFSCVIGGKLFQVCEHEASFCRQTFTNDGPCVLGFINCNRTAHNEIVPVDKYQYLIDSGLECGSDNFHPVLGGE